MKASMKFREDQKPLLRAKVPVGILGFPFVSGISGGDASDLSFSIQTAWIPGLSLKFSYRPNDSYNPFVFAVKSGIGIPNSPEKSSVLAMGAEFSLLRRGNPCFMLQIKPEIGDFSLRRSVVSPSGGNHRAKLGASSDEIPVENRGENGMMDIPVERMLNFKDSLGHSTAAAGMQEFISGTAIMARTKFPLTKNGFLKIRWGVNFPPDMHAAGSSFRHSFTGVKLPFLTVNKISIENVESAAGPPATEFPGKEGRHLEVALSKGMLGMMKEDMEALRRENDVVRETIRELKSVIGKQNGGNLLGTDFSDVDDKTKKKRNGADNGTRERKLPEYSARSGSSSADISEELKKAIRGSSGA
ncbi:uncharacterized protein LOC116252239 [Nymphaea colorata]|nr:uncharacterized protein LOC116252239 [Nymphaea colorata]